jgi:LytS/YehU family sensor histidine kinase
VLLTVAVTLNAIGQAARERLVLAVAAALAGCVVASALRYLVGATPAGQGAGFILYASIVWFVPAAALTAGYVFLLRMRAAREEAQEAELRSRRFEQQRVEAKLRLLQAQIEPHFLFNTLSNVRRLCQNDAAAGRAMLAHLTRYLRAALPKMRESESTLADELELVSAYLGVQQIRLGSRLRTTIEVAEPLRKLKVPPLILATLVENAIKHGIAPSSGGGSIDLRAARAGDSLVLTVADTGRGFAAESGTGVGLANIRSRLAAAYGEDAGLRLEANEPQGVRATIRLPWPERGAA